MHNSHTTLTDIVLLDILEKLGIHDVDEVKKNAYKEKLAPLIENRILRALLLSLTEEEKLYFMLPDEANAFNPEMLTELLNIPGKQAIVEKELAVLLEELTFLPGIE